MEHVAFRLGDKFRLGVSQNGACLLDSFLLDRFTGPLTGIHLNYRFLMGLMLTNTRLFSSRGQRPLDPVLSTHSWGQSSYHRHVSCMIGP